MNEFKLQAIAAALHTIADVIGGGRGNAVSSNVPAQVQPQVQPQQAPVALDTAQIRLGQIAQQVDEAGKVKLAQLIHGYGAARLSDVPAEHLPDLMAKAEALIHG